MLVNITRNITSKVRSSLQGGFRFSRFQQQSNKSKLTASTMALKMSTWTGVALWSISLLFTAVSGAPTSDSLPQPCVNGLMNLVSCLNSSSTNGEVGIKINIAQRCNSLTAMSKCRTSIPHECRALQAFTELESLFSLSGKISDACSSPVGRKNMLDLTECNGKIPEAFETCFNFTVIDHALQFHSGVSQNFANMCCAIRNGQNCYSSTVVSQCGDKGKNALDATVGFLFRAMNCHGSIACP